MTLHRWMPQPVSRGWPDDLVDGTEAGAKAVHDLVQRALALRAGAAPRQAHGKRVAAIFLNPSLRTRTSLCAACHALGVHASVLNPGTDMWRMEMGEGVVMDGDAAEHVRDAVGVLAQMHDVIAIRAFATLNDRKADLADKTLTAFRGASAVPVVNLESALYHPMQGFADVATWQHHLGPDLRGKRLTLTWAPHPKALPAAVANQVLISAAQQGMEVTVAHPEGFDLEPSIMGRAKGLASHAGGAVRVTHNQKEGLAGAQVVVAKSWSGVSGYSDRTEEATRRAAAADWCVDDTAMAHTADAGFMHCLPVRRNVVATDSVMDGPNSWVQETAGLRLWTAMAFFERLLAS
ncbi:MAG: N-acetylornithine carbamoyltransferase [Myxococcales bacterium]|nr:N-acetylornithine carbamoyltransferase [Myxococcales bacterium]